MPDTKIPGIAAKHCIITPTCVEIRGAAGAFDEAVARLRAEYMTCREGWKGAKVPPNYHLVLTVERTPEPVVAVVADDNDDPYIAGEKIKAMYADQDAREATADPPPPVDRSNTVALHSGEARDGHPNADKGAPGDLKENGQHSDYWVLSEEERAKGFVRPVRQTYSHSGARPTYPTREMTDAEKERYADVGYVLFEIYPEDKPGPGRFWKQEQLDSGCGATTTMNIALAETYAREPRFYGATYCCACGEHFPVAEFTWSRNGRDGTDEVVGS